MYSQDFPVSNEVKVEILGMNVKVTGPKGELVRDFTTGMDIAIENKDGKITVSAVLERRDVRSVVGTIAAHIRNMIKGVTEGFVYKLKIIYSHFPVTAKIEGEKIIIQNFLGEKAPRMTKIVGKTTVEIKGQEITVTGISKEDVGQTAGNLEQITRISGYDRRTFMDGIYIVSKSD